MSRVASARRRSLDDLVEAALSKSAAWRLVGGLSRTQKMPCHSWGIPANRCQTGARLARVIGSVCGECYATKHAYTWPTVQAAYERRLAAADHPDWVDAMSVLVDWQAGKNDAPYFRWFDSGDLQSPSMLERIVAVAAATPDVHHWLPTRELGILRDYLEGARAPPNLTIRLSAALIDGDPPNLLDLPTSTVYERTDPAGYRCPAYDQTPTSCGPCRACWKPDVPNVSYPRH